LMYSRIFFANQFGIKEKLWCTEPLRTQLNQINQFVFIVHDEPLKPPAHYFRQEDETLRTAQLNLFLLSLG
jgi:hypothetical protein